MAGIPGGKTGRAWGSPRNRAAGLLPLPRGPLGKGLLSRPEAREESLGAGARDAVGDGAGTGPRAEAKTGNFGTARIKHLRI